MIANKMSLGLFIFGIFYANIALGDTYRCRNSKGQTEFRNTLCPEGSTTEKTRIITPSTQASNKPQQMGVTPMWETPPGYIREGSTDSGEFDFDSLMAAVTNAKTIDEKRAKAGQLAGALAAYKATATQKAIASAKRQAGVDALEAQFQQDMILDRKAEFYNGTMSDITKETYARLQNAKREADSLVNEYLAKQAEQEVQLKLEEMRQQLQQTEIERELDKEEQENAAEEAKRDAEEMAQEAIEKAEQAAEELRDEMNQSAIRTKNNLYSGVLLLAIGSFFAYFITKYKKENNMNDDQKYGVAIMIVSFLLILLAVMISDGWLPHLDFLANFMYRLQVQQIIIGNGYLVDAPTKYVVWVLLTTAAYGLATYLGITPAFRPWKKISGGKWHDRFFS